MEVENYVSETRSPGFKAAPRWYELDARFPGDRPSSAEGGSSPPPSPSPPAIQGRKRPRDVDASPAVSKRVRFALPSGESSSVTSPTAESASRAVLEAGEEGSHETEGGETPGEQPPARPDSRVGSAGSRGPLVSYTFAPPH